MPTPAIVSTLATTQRTYGLLIGGTDVLASPGGYGVEVGSVRVTEAGPGGVSELSVDVEDAPKLLAFPDGSEVVMYDHVRNVTEFRGFLDTYGMSPWPGGQSRTFVVAAIGIEALLDWKKMPAQTVAGGGASSHEWIAAQLTNLGFRKAITSSDASPQLSSLEQPIAGYEREPGDPVTVVPAGLPEAFTYAGVTAREFIRINNERSVAQDSAGPPTNTSAQIVQATMDFYGGVRVWQDYPGVIPSDYTNLTISDAGPIRHNGLDWRREPGQLIRRVYVNGLNAASSGWVEDGSGISGQEALISDDTITTALDRDNAGRALIRDSAAGILRGEVFIEDWNPPGTVHAGSYVTITDAATGLVAQTARIMSIEKQYLAGAAARQTWKVAFGSLPPRATTLMRRLTRTMLR